MNEIVRREMPLSDLQMIAKTFDEGGLFPQWKGEAQILSLMLVCQSEGCDPVSAMQRYDNIQGRVSKKPIAMLEDFIKAGGKHQWIESTDKIAKLRLITPNGSEHIETFTIEDAKKAQLSGKDVWRKYPKAMLRARCTSAGLRAADPAATNLLYTPEETESFTPKKVAAVEVDVVDVTQVGDTEVAVAAIEPEPATPDVYQGKCLSPAESEPLLERIHELSDKHNVSPEIQQKWLDRFGRYSLLDLTDDERRYIVDGLEEKYEGEEGERGEQRERRERREQ